MKPHEMQALKAYLSRTGISHRSFAKRLNVWLGAQGSSVRVTKSAVTFWCTGERHPRQTAGRAIVAVTKNAVTVGDIFESGEDLFDSQESNNAR